MMGLSLKIGVVSATAVMLKLLSPFIMNLSISDLPIIWTSLVSWLEPPYLYVLINAIIIAIFAFSRLQSDVVSHVSISTSPTPSTEPLKVELQPEVTFHGGLMETEPVDMAKFVEVRKPEFSAPYDQSQDADMKELAYEEIKKNRVINKSVISSISAWKPSDINQVGLAFPAKKPPASARFSHRKLTKATPDGGRSLGVAKPKRQDSLESTWKAINEGRSVPLTRHLRKSDTWETHGHGRENRNSEELITDNHNSERMTKSETFDVNRRKPVKPPTPQSKLNRSGGSGRLKKEPSLGQEELNRRVEAFIKKFNEDMRLQREESLNQYMEMINRGAH